MIQDVLENGITIEVDYKLTEVNVRRGEENLYSYIIHPGMTINEFQSFINKLADQYSKL